MRKTEVSGWMGRSSSRVLTRALRLSAIVLGLGVLMTSHAARAGDDDDGETFEQKIIGNIMRGIGATNMENAGIDYRERSPLVVPPNLDLPPPVSANSEVSAPNWPKDPDVQRRKAAIAANRKTVVHQSQVEAAQPLSPDELNRGRTASRGTPSDPLQPGETPNPMMSPSQLGFDKIGSIFHGKDTESKKFTTEPPRETLTEPPPGYQTPSPDYAYGTGPIAPLGQKHYDIMSGKEVQ